MMFFTNTIIPIKILNEKAHLPTRGSKYAAGYDLYAAIDHTIIIAPHTTEKIGTGIAVELPEGTFGGIFARSGLATKKGLRPANCEGIIDSDYRGELIVAIHNDTEASQVIEPHERIAQLIVMPYIEQQYEIVDKLNETDRGSSGFGSTGSK